MSVTVLVDLALKPETADRVVSALEEVLPATRAFEGCRGVQLLVDLHDPSHVVLLEDWESIGHQEAYAAWRAESGTSPLSPDVFAAPRRNSYFTARF